MTTDTVMPELDVFQLPVFADADIWPMWPTGKLEELADDIKDNGFDHRYPITIAEIDGQWMLLDGRNRREAARIAEIIPPFIVTDINPKLAVHRSNNQNRDATPGQKAMATAMAFPEAKRGMHSELKNLTGTAKVYISQARYVLRNNPPASDSEYPQYALDVMAGLMTLTEAYDATQKDMARREEEDRIKRENDAKRSELESRYPDLAALVAEDKLSLSRAIAAAEQADREAAEEAERIRREEEARLAEEERQRLEEERKREEIEKNIRLTLFESFNDLVTGSTVWAGLELTKERIKLLHDPRFEQERMQWPALQKFDRKTILKALDGLQAVLKVYP